MAEDTKNVNVDEDGLIEAQIDKFDPEKITGMKLVDHLPLFMGQKIAFLCARYQYRGVLSAIGEDFVILSDATSVEISGASSRERPQTEDPLRSSAIVKLDAVEIISQTRWCLAPLPSEENYQASDNNN